MVIRQLGWLLRSLQSSLPEYAGARRDRERAPARPVVCSTVGRSENVVVLE